MREDHSNEEESALLSALFAPGETIALGEASHLEPSVRAESLLVAEDIVANFVRGIIDDRFTPRVGTDPDPRLVW